MTYEWVILAAIVFVSILPLIKWLRRLLWAFALAFGGMMLIHMQHNPGEATMALGVMGGGMVFGSPLRRILMRGMV